MATEKTPNYTDAMVQTMEEMYRNMRFTDGKSNAETVDAISAALNRPVKSVRAKLVRNGVYVKEDAPAKVETDKGPTKKEMLNALEQIAPDFPVDGLAPATKEVITEVIALFESLRALENHEQEEAA